MRIHDREVGWAEGECLVFDDTYRHEVTHDGDSPRVVLLIQVKRPLKAPGRQIADLFLAGLRNSPFVQEAREQHGQMGAGDERPGPALALSAAGARPGTLMLAARIPGSGRRR